MTDIVVTVVIAGACIGIICKKIKDIRSGKISCGGSCIRCDMECRNQGKLK